MNSFARLRNLDTLAMDNRYEAHGDGGDTHYHTPLPGGASRDQYTHLINRIPAGMFDKCRDVTVGVGVVIEDGVRFMCDKVTVGDFVYIGRGTTIRTPEFSVGDYTRINEASYCGGRKPLRIGRNVYLGRGVYLDSNGGLTLEDNTLAGAYSQLWTHIEGGDMIQGVNARWHQERELVIEKDAWLVGRVVVSHAERIGARSLVLNESNVLHNIPADTTWAGNPAKDVTDKLGRQFEELSDDEKCARLRAEIGRFWSETVHSIGVLSFSKFDAVTRTYHKQRSAAEVAFMRFTSGKFTPTGEE